MAPIYANDKAGAILVLRISARICGSTFAGKDAGASIATQQLAHKPVLPDDSGRSLKVGLAQRNERTLSI